MVGKARQQHTLLSRICVPQNDRAEVPSGRQDLALRGESQGKDVVAIRLERHPLLSGNPIPEAHIGSTTPGRQQLAVWRTCHTPNRQAMLPDDNGWLALRQVP